jgi:hypothetical protein
MMTTSWLYPLSRSRHPRLSDIGPIDSHELGDALQDKPGFGLDLRKMFTPK